MNFESAIAVHAGWKIKLRKYIEYDEGEYDPAVVEQDNKCELGQWLYGDGQAYKEKQSFPKLVETHAEFHHCAADVIRQVQKGDKQAAKESLESGKDFVNKSLEVVTHIRGLREEIGE